MKNPSELKRRTDRILQAGERVFAAKGYHATNVEDVIQAAHISRATFYTHFKNKEDLFAAIVGQLLEAQSSFILELQAKFLSRSPDFGSAIEEIIRTMEREAKRNSDQLKVILSVVQGSGTQAEKHFNQIQQRTLDHFTNLIQRNIEQLGYSAAAARSLAYILIGGLIHVGKAILYGVMSKREITQFLRGMQEVLQAAMHEGTARGLIRSTGGQRRHRNANSESRRS